VVGRIVRPHGIRGEVVVEPSTDAPHRFAPGNAMRTETRRLTIAASRAHQGRLLVQFEEIAERDGAEALRGALLTIPIEDAAPAAEGRYYPHQLAGLGVFDEFGNALGEMGEVLEYPASDLWVVRTPDGKDVMVPAVREIVLDVDLANGRIVLRPPEGLFE
jgi:16S rRNA processing protein RimM